MISSLAEAKIFLNITDNDQDDLLTNLLEYANDFIKSYTWRDFEVSDYEERIDGKWQSIITKQFPVNSLTSFQYNTWTLWNPVWEDFDEDNYFIDTNGILCVTHIPCGTKNIKLNYNAWYSTANMPQDIVLAVNQLVWFYYNTNESSGISKEKIDDWELTFEANQQIPNNILVILKKYRNVQTF